MASVVDVGWAGQEPVLPGLCGAVSTRALVSVDPRLHEAGDNGGCHGKNILKVSQFPVPRETRGCRFLLLPSTNCVTVDMFAPVIDIGILSNINHLPQT